MFRHCVYSAHCLRILFYFASSVSFLFFSCGYFNIFHSIFARTQIYVIAFWSLKILFVCPFNRRVQGVCMVKMQPTKRMAGSSRLPYKNTFTLILFDWRGVGWLAHLISDSGAFNKLAISELVAPHIALKPILTDFFSVECLSMGVCVLCWVPDECRCRCSAQVSLRD